MRIAQIAPLAESVPPKLYGGTERVIWWLAEALVDLGHDVTLFASGDSETSARLVPYSETGLRLAGVDNHTAYTLVMLDAVLRRQAEFDIIHFHTDLYQYPMFRALAGKTVTTLHGRLDIPDMFPVFRAFSEFPLVSISDHQRQAMPFANYARTIHHGLPDRLIPFSAQDDGYLAFIGRISPEKRPDRAIEIAKAAGLALKIAAKVDRVDEAYFREAIAPMIDDPAIEFIGEIGDADKPAFLGGARALLFPIDWPEPFGLVMIEAMAAGTPVIAWRNGSTPEVIEPHVNGVLVDTIDEAVAAARTAHALPRAGVRNAFEQRFTARRMAKDYVALYEALIHRDRPLTSLAGAEMTTFQ